MDTPLHEGEEILLTVQPHSKFAWYWALSRCWHAVLFLIIMAILFVFQGSSTSKQSISQQFEHTKEISASFFSHYGAAVFVALIVVAVVLFFVVYLWARFASKGYSYTLTNQRVILNYGFLSLNKRIIPYSNINDVNMRCFFIERIFGLTSVYLDSIGTIMGGASFRSNRNSNNTTRLEGITIEESEKVMEIVSKHLTRQQQGI